MFGFFLVVVYSGEKFFLMDDDGYSDFYCIVIVNKEKVFYISWMDNLLNLNNLLRLIFNFINWVFEFCLKSLECFLI